VLIGGGKRGLPITKWWCTKEGPYAQGGSGKALFIKEKLFRSLKKRGSMKIRVVNILGLLGKGLRGVERKRYVGIYFYTGGTMGKERANKNLDRSQNAGQGGRVGNRETRKTENRERNTA